MRIWIAIALLLTHLPASAGGRPPAAEHIAQMLTDRLAADPASRALAPVLRRTAEYYAGFPELEPLFGRIASVRFTIAYGADQHRTAGTRARLVVYFDPLSAAQYRFRNACRHTPAHCRAAPADVLLHEFLHIATLAERQWTQAPLYPLVEEQLIIDQEARLYAAMNARDGKSRPLRVDHRGRAVRVACALCVM